jgi:hypothetical protein
MARAFGGSSALYRNTNAPITSLVFTVACWCRADNSSGGYFFTLNDSTSPTAYYRAYYSGGGQPEFSTPSGACQTSTTASINAWDHVCVVSASATSRSVYLNGGGKATDTASYEPVSWSFPLFTVGSNWSSGSIFQAFTGDLSDFAVWDVALTDAEVLALSSGTPPTRIRPGNLVAYYPIEAGAGYLLNRWAGTTDRTLTLDGSAPTAATGPRVAPAFGAFDGGRGAYVTQVTWQGSALLAGIGALTATGRLLAVASAQFAGVGALAADATVLDATDVAYSSAADAYWIAGGDAGTTDATGYTQEAGRLYAISLIDVTPSGATLNAEALLAGVGNLVANTQVLRVASAAFAGVGSLTASAGLALPASALLAGTGTLTASVQRLLAASALLAGEGSLVATASLQQAISALLAGSGALAVDLTTMGTAQANALLEGAGGLTASVNQLLVAQAQLAGASSLTAAATLQLTVAATFAGESVLTADVATMGVAQANALFAGASSLTAAANLTAKADALLAGTGTLTALLRGITTGEALFAGESALVADIVVPSAVIEISALLTGAGRFAETTASPEAFEAWWDFIDDGTDATGNGNDGTLNGTTPTIDLYGRPARLFNGTTDFISGASSPLEP